MSREFSADHIHPRAILTGKPGGGPLSSAAESAHSREEQNDVRLNNGWEQHVVRVLTALLFAGIAFTLARPLFSSISWMSFVQDDFFYYLVVARNIAHGHGSTFNGIVATNGYQPLWLACLVAFSFFAGDSRLVLGFIAVSSLIASIATFLLAGRLIRKTGVRPLLVYALSAWTTVSCVSLFFGGMEVILTIPIALGVLCLLQEVEWLARGPRNTFLLGLVLSAMVLSRLDSLIFAGILLLGVLVSPSLRRLLRWDLALGALLGLFPVFLYFASNRLLFHVWLPVSGMAKQLRTGFFFSARPIECIIRQPYHLIQSTYLVMLVSIFLLPGVLARLRPMQRVFVVSALVFPVVYYTILSFLSDWILWEWYFYPFLIAACTSAVVLCSSPASSRFLQRSAVSWTLALAIPGYALTHRWMPKMQEIEQAAQTIRAFAITHPGVYAMGDGSGSVAYLLPYPLVQLEGLMMDRDFLDEIARQVPLRDVLSQYHVRYYIGTSPSSKPCFEAIEPAQGGSHSAHMRAQFCETPVAVVQSAADHEIAIFDLGEGANESSAAPPIANQSPTR